MNENEVIRTKCGGNEESSDEKITVNPDGSYCAMLHSDGSMTDLSHLCGATTAGEQAEPAQVDIENLARIIDVAKERELFEREHAGRNFSKSFTFEYAGEYADPVLENLWKGWLKRAAHSAPIQAAPASPEHVQAGYFLPKRDVADEIVLLSNVMRHHPQLKSVIGREALLMRCVQAGLAEEAAKLAPILRSMCEGGGEERHVDIYADDYQPGDGDVFVTRAADLLDEIAAAPIAAAPAQIPQGCAIDSNGTTYHNVAETYYQAEAGDALAMWLDDQGIPRADADGNEYSPVGRVMRLVEKSIAAAPAAPSVDVKMLSSALKHAHEALCFYADGQHFHMHQPDEWDTVSGEPQNFYEDSNNTATVEDGSVAKQAMEDIALVGMFAYVAASEEASPAAEQVQTDAARNQALEDEVARLKKQIEKKHKSHFITSQALHNQIVGNQAAWIEWQHGAGAEAAMTWIHNSLVGPGLIPDGKEAQPWFNANVDDRYEIPPMKDGAMKTATNEGEARDE